MISDQVSEASAPPGGGADPAYAVGFLLRQAHVRAARAFNEALRPLGIEGRHFAVLSSLSAQPLSQRALVDLIGSDKATMVRIVDDLQGKGIVTREPALRDRRAYAVTLTEHGAATLAAAQQAARKVATDLLAHMSTTDRQHLIALLADFAAPQRYDHS